MKTAQRVFRAFSLFALAGIFSASASLAATKTWNNTGTDFNAAGSWTTGAPTSADRMLFNTAETTQPKLSASVTIQTLVFDVGSSGYNITNTSTEVLSLSQNGAGGAATTAAIFANNTSGTNTVSAPINLTSANAQTINQNGNGGTLILNGVISSTNAISVNFNVTGASSILLNNANTYTGPTVLGGATLASNPTINVGNNSAFSTGALSFSAGVNIAAFGGARTIANATTLSASAIVGGSNALEFSGTFQNSGSATRTFTLNNTALTTLSGNVYLSEASGTGRNLEINGTGAGLISGVVANFNGGAGTGSNITYNGTNTLTLSNTNTYTGNTAIRGGGTVSVSTIGNSGANGGVGAGTQINFGSTTSSGTLLYTGSGETTNKVINLNGTTGGATLDQSGTGALVFSANLTDTGTAATDNRKTLTLQGSTAGTGEISGNIVDSTNGNTGQKATSVVKTGSGLWTLSGTNTYTGGTNVNGGTLLANNTSGSATGSGGVMVNANGTLGGTGIINAGSNNININANGTITGAKNGTVGALTLTAANVIFAGTDASNVATYAVDISGATSDRLNITGVLDLSNAFDRISFTGTADGITTYVLATYTSETGTFDSFPTLPGGYSLVYGATELDLTPTAVPEVSTWVMGALALSTILWSQRRRFGRA